MTTKKADEAKNLPAEVPAVSGKGVVAVADADVDLYSDGDDFSSQDLTIPFLRIAQKLSPQVDKDAAEFIPGLEPGMIFNTATGEFWEADAGVPVVIGTTRRELTEWKPRGSGDGSGLVANHGTDLSPLGASDVGKNEKGKPITGGGNELVEAMQYYVLQTDLETGMADPAVISMSSSNFKPARDLNLMIRTAKFQTPDGRIINKPSSFLYVYRLTTVKRSNADGTWYVFKAERFCLTEELKNGRDLLIKASEFKKMVIGGQVTADHENAGGEGDTDGDAPF